MPKVHNIAPADRAGTHILFIGFKGRVDKHYTSTVEGANFLGAFETWLNTGKTKSGKFTAFVLENGQPGETYATVVDFSDVNSVYTASFKA
jgi:hypothetical protein